ncbi:MAG: hypothetical protein ACE5HO_04005 [bacterium]
MFRTAFFYDSFGDFVASQGKLYTLVGVGLILSAIVIFIMPEIIAYLISAILIWLGVLLVTIAFRLRKLRRQTDRRFDRTWELFDL